MTAYLVCAHETLMSPELMAALRRHVDAESASFHVVVPMSHHVGMSGWSEGEIRAHARHDLDLALELYRASGFEVSGAVGDVHPVDAVLTALVTHPTGAFDGIIVSTLPNVVSRWLRLDAVTRLRRETELPVEHVVGSRVPAST